MPEAGGWKSCESMDFCTKKADLLSGTGSTPCDAYYESPDPAHAGGDKSLMRKTAGQLRRNFRALKKRGIKLSPSKMNLFLYLPEGAGGIVLGMVFRSRFANRFMYEHSMKAPDEMAGLHAQFYEYIEHEEPDIQ